MHISWGGAIQVEGAWYCASLPQSLIDATFDYREGRITEQVWRQRIRARTAYLLRPKASPDADGRVRMLCPAAGTAPTARCDLKPASLLRTKGGTTRVTVLDDIAFNRPLICKQETITIPREVGAKFEQELQYGTDEWERVYATLRNTIEGVNGTSKDVAFEALGTPTRHRIRGVAAQTVFAAFALFGTNMRAIDSFETDAVIGSDGELCKPRKSRRAAPTSITLTMARRTLVKDETEWLTATGAYRRGARDVTRKVIWASSDEGVASVDDLGFVTAHASGTATLSATLGSTTGTTTLKVTRTPPRTQR